MLIIRYSVLYIIICLGSIFFADKYHKKIESCFVLTFLFTILGLYVASFLRFLEASVWGIAIFWIILGIYTLWKHREKKDNFFRQQVLTTGFLLFTVLFFAFLIFSFSKILTSWDQYSNWSIVTKNAYYTNSWVADVGIHYPPVPTALQYFFMKIAGEYRQGIESFAMQMLTFSCLLTLLEWTKQRKIQKIAVFVMIICIPAIFAMMNFYDSSYPDTFMGILLGLILTTYLLEDNKKYQKFILVLSFIALTLTKATGVFISIIGIIMLFLYEFFSKREKQSFKKILTSSKVKLCLVFLLIVIGTYLSWKGYQAFYVGELEEASTQQIRENKGNIISYLWNSFTIASLGVGNENAIDGAKSLGTLLEDMNQNIAITKPVYLNMISTIFLLLGISILLYAKYFKNNKSKFKWGMIVFGLGLILYILVLQLAYMLVFSTDEMVGHNGLDRYLPTFFLSIIYFMVSITLKEIKEVAKNQNLAYVIITFAILLVTPINLISNNTITTGIHEIEEKLDWQEVRGQAAIIQEQLEQRQVEEVWLFSSTQNGGDVLYENAIRYTIFPTIKAKSINSYKQQELEEAVEKLQQEEISYLYIWNIDEKLEEYLETDLKERTLYQRVKQEDGNFLWEEIK